MKKILPVIYGLHFILKFLVPNHALVSNELIVEVLDVGQGDAILVTTPSRAHILIDGGEGFDVDRYVDNKMPLWTCYLDVVILTHPHSDHLSGLSRILDHCEVGLILANDVSYDSALYAYWQNQLVTQNILSVFVGDTFVVDGVIFMVLWPPEGFTDENVNNLSVVLHMYYDGFDALFTGDAEKEVLGSVDAPDFTAGILELYKVSHHGAVNGLHGRFLNDIKPVYSAISVGKDNTFGHPSAETVEFLEGMSAVYRTDLLGTLEFVTGN